MEHHPETDRLQLALKHVAGRASRWTGIVFRSCGMHYARRSELVSGRGARRHGGRWSPPGVCEAVYASLEPETAMAERLGSYRYYDLSVAEAMPLVVVALTVRWSRVLDVTDPTVTDELQADPARLFGDDWRELQRAGRECLSQALGRVAWERGLGGLLVPSAQVPGTKNFVLFPGNRRRGDLVQIQRSDAIPP